MDESQPPDTAKPVEMQIRELGFDPDQLTPREREELVEMYRRFPDEVITATVR